MRLAQGTEPSAEALDEGRARHVEVEHRIGACWVERRPESHDEGRVDAELIEDPELGSQLGRLFRLLADVGALEPERGAVTCRDVEDVEAVPPASAAPVYVQQPNSVIRSDIGQREAISVRRPSLTCERGRSRPPAVSEATRASSAGFGLPAAADRQLVV